MLNPEKHILVAGATSGIGKAIVELLCTKNALVLTSRQSEAETALNSIEGFDSAKHSIFRCDVTHHDEIQQMVEDCPVLDGLVYCPGIAAAIPTKHLMPANVAPVMDVNFHGAMYMTAALLRKKKILPGSSIVFISSEAVRHPYFGSAAYSASKAALEAFALALANELQPKKIRVNVVSPAFVETPMLEQGTSNFSDTFVEAMKKMHPEAFGDASQIATIIEFLLSSASSSVNAQIIQAGRFNINIPPL